MKIKWYYYQTHCTWDLEFGIVTLVIKWSNGDRIWTKTVSLPLSQFFSEIILTKNSKKWKKVFFNTYPKLIFQLILGTRKSAHHHYLHYIHTYIHTSFKIVIPTSFSFSPKIINHAGQLLLWFSSWFFIIIWLYGLVYNIVIFYLVFPEKKIENLF